MKKAALLLALALILAMVVPAAAEVEEITVGGSIQARYQYLNPGFTVNQALMSRFSFDDDINSMYWGTQRTLINVDAKLTGGVRAFAEVQAFDFWGIEEDEFFIPVEPDATTAIAPPGGISAAASYPYDGYGFYAGQGNSPVEMYQAYIEMDNIADTPLMLRVGRQELVYGREWLLGNNNAGMNFSGLSFDGVKAGYATDVLTVDAWWMQLQDFSTPLQFESLEDSVDFFGVYGTYSGIENTAVDAYFLWVRSDLEKFTELTYAVDIDTDNLYTVGARIAGCWDSPLGLLDYNVEGAYQFGDAENHITGSGDYSAWAFDALAGYTFDQVAWAPRLELEYSFFSGGDADDEEEDIETFNRLFSDVHYGEMNLGGNLDSAMTNMHIFRGGVSAAPMEHCTLSADVYYFLLANDDGLVLGAPDFNGEDNLGWELDLAADYQYTEDLNLRAGWAHFFADDATENLHGNSDDEDYVYAQALLVF
jgi:hypothetical protein